MVARRLRVLAVAFDGKVQRREDGRVQPVHAVDTEKGLILLKGAVPGPRGGLVVIRSAAKRVEG